MRGPALVSLGVLLVAGHARADAVDAKLASYENEARVLGTNLPAPDQVTAQQHTLTQAEAMYAVGDYDGAALALFDIYDSLQGADKQAAAYYLGEAINQQGDRSSAREYYKAAVAGGSAGHYYVLAQQRLVELAIADRDLNEAATGLQTLDASASGQPAVTYLHGKLAFAQGKYDDATSYFTQVPKGSDYELEATYFLATIAITKKDLARATDLFSDLTTRSPRTANDRRVLELSSLALGRVYYERDELTKSIDAYLAVDRHSDLFSDALYEVSWAYVKSKQYDKALRALELLEQADSSSARTPTVRILEGNLRIRKAQMLRQQQIDGTINNDEHSSPSQEYDRADKLFSETHDLYYPSFVALKRAVTDHADAKAYVDQVAGRSQHVFQLAPPLPIAAAQMLRDDPGVAQFVGIEEDLANIHASIAQSEAAIRQMEAKLDARDHSRLFPAIASRRARIEQMAVDLVAMRAQLADQENDPSADTQGRHALVQQYFALGNPEQAYTQRVEQQRAQIEKVAEAANEVSSAIDSAQAIAIAMRSYADSPKAALPAQQAADIVKAIESAAVEAQQIEDELDALRRDIALAHHLAGVGDEQIAQARTLVKQCKAAEDAEMATLASHGRSTSAMQRAARLADTIAQLDQTLDASVEQGVARAKATLGEERKMLEDYKGERARLEDQARSEGGAALSANLQGVVDKLYDIVIRSDVGTVDVAWSEKEDTDDDLKRLNLVRSRELKQLRDEFKDILDEATQKTQPVRARSLMPTSTEGPQQSPDMTKGGGDRIKPVDNSTSTTQPTVKPEQNAPKQGAPKKGGTP